MTGIMTSHEPPRVLVLHTSCPETQQEDGISLEKSNSSSSMDVNAILGSLPIVCDILVLPEIPDQPRPARETSRWFSAWFLGEMEETKAVEIPNQIVERLYEPLNPCGVDNLLLLEDLPWHQVLLSLTSCHLNYHEESFNTTLQLPVEVTPSTFAVSFSQSLTELDLSIGTAHAKDILASSLDLGDEFNTVEAVDAPSISADVLPRQETELQDIEGMIDATAVPLSDESSSHIVHLPISESFMWEICMLPPSQPQVEDTVEMANPKISQELEAIARVHAMMEQDNANLDLMIRLLSYLAVGLLGLLLWAGYQYYQDRLGIQRARVLRTAVERKLHIHPPRRPSCPTTPTTPTSTPTATPSTSTTVPPRTWLTPPFPQGNVSWDHVPILSPRYIQNWDLMVSNTPRISNLSAAVAAPRTSTGILESYSPRVPSFHTKETSSYNCSDIAHFDTLASKRNNLSEDCCDNPVSLESPKKNSFTAEDGGNKENLSPCSKFSKSWKETKSVRRNHRKKRTTKLEPFASPTSVCGTNTSGSTMAMAPQSQAMVEEDDAETFLVSRNHSNSNLADLELSHETAPTNGTLSRAHNESNNRYSTPTSRPPPIPDLVCATPGSADSAFVEDYW